MSNIDEFLTKLVDRYTHIITNPKTMEKLQKQGVKFDKPVQKTEEQRLDELFAQRRQEAASLLSKFPSAPQIAIPTIGFLYDEIRECIIFGLNGAAVSLSAVLVEFSLKHAIVEKNRGNIYDKSEWDRIENMELGPTIKEAKRLGIIDDALEKEINRFKNTVRNPYLHYNIKKITKNVVANDVKKFNVNTDNIEEANLSAEDNPIIWGFAKKFVDRENVFNIFNFADALVKYLFEKNMTVEEYSERA